LDPLSNCEATAVRLGVAIQLSIGPSGRSGQLLHARDPALPMSHCFVPSRHFHLCERRLTSAATCGMVPNVETVLSEAKPVAKRSDRALGQGWIVKPVPTALPQDRALHLTREISPQIPRYT
jgi:hypothetical protein